MPLTRRIQVFINEEASGYLDRLTEKTGSQRAAIEYALGVAANPPSIAEVALRDHLKAKLDSHPVSSLDTKPRSKTAEELGLKPCLVHHVIGCHMCASCSHPAKARRGKKCLDCGISISD